MGKYELKTKKNKASVASFLNAIDDPQKRADAKAIDKMMRDITGKKPIMWGSSIIGYGTYHYKYPSGQEGDWMMTGFSPRKANLTIYVMPGYQNADPLLKKLGPHSKGKSCLYIKRLSDIHIPTLKKIVKNGVTYMKKHYEIA